MSDGDGVLSDGTELHLSSAVPTLTKIIGLKSCNRPNLQVAKEENTTHDSGGTKSYKPGHGDMQDLRAVILYEPGSPTDILLNEHLASKATRPGKIVTPQGGGTTQDHTCNVFLTGYEPDDAPLGGIRNATITGVVTPMTQADT